MPRYVKNYSRGLSWFSLSNVIWENLSNFWQLIHNKGYVTVGWKSWMDLSPVLSDYIRTFGMDIPIEANKYKAPQESPMPIELTFDSTTETGEFADQYYVDVDLRELLVLQDFLNEPGVQLVLGDGSFTFTTPVSSKGRGKITFSPTTNYPSKMWLTAYTNKWVDELISRWGPFVDWYNVSYMENKVTKLELYVKAALRALLRAQEFGPVIPHLESVICVVNDWPYSPVLGRIISLSTTTMSILDAVTNEVYNITDTTGLGFSHKVDGVWTPLAYNDVLYPLEPLTNAVEIIDLQIDPFWWLFLPVGWAEKWHTFLVKFNPNLPYDTTEDSTTEDHYDFMNNEALFKAMIDRHKSIGSKPYYAILWDWQLACHTYAAPDIMYESFETGIMSSIFVVPSSLTPGIMSEFGVIPDLFQGAGVFKEGEYVATPESSLYNTDLGVEPLAPVVGVYSMGTTPATPAPGVFAVS